MLSFVKVSLDKDASQRYDLNWNDGVNGCSKEGSAYSGNKQGIINKDVTFRFSRFS